MKTNVTRFFIAFLFLTLSNQLFAQVKIGDNPNTIDINSLLELESTSKGLLFPRLTTAQMNGMVAPLNGLVIYNTATSSLYVRSAGVWKSLAFDGGTGAGWGLTGNMGTNPALNFLGTTDNVNFNVRTNNTQRLKIDSTGKISIGTELTDALLRVQGEGRPFAFGASQFSVNLYSRPTGVNAAGTGIVYGFLSHAQTTTTGTYNALAGRILQTDTTLANLTGAIGHTNYTATFGANGLNTALLGIVNARQNQLNDNTIYSAATLNVAATTTAAQDSNTYVLYTPPATMTRKSYHAGRLGIGTQYPSARLQVVGEGNLFPFGASMFNVAIYSRPTGVNSMGTQIVYGVLSHTTSTTTGTYNALAGRTLQTADTSLANLTGAIAHTNYTAAFGANGLNTALLGIVNARENQSNDNTIYAASTLNIAGTATTSTLQDSSTYLLYTPPATLSRKSYHAGRFGIGTQYPSARLQVVGEGNLFPFGASMFNVAIYSRPTGVNAMGTQIVYGVLSHTQTTTTGTYNALAGRSIQAADTSLANLTGAIAHTNYTAAFGANGLNTALLGIVNARENQSNDNTIYAASTLNVAGTATTGTLQDSSTYLLYTPPATINRKSYHAGRFGIGTQYPSARLQVVGEGSLFNFGPNQFNVAVYSRPTGVNASATGIVYGLLSHSQSTTTGAYNAVAGRILRADTSLANLTGAIGHTNYSAGNGFNTALLGIVNARENQLNDNTVYSGLRLTDATTGLTAMQMANTYTVFAPTAVKSYFEGSIGIGSSTPATKLQVNGAITYMPATSASAAVTVGDRSFINLNTTGIITLTNGLAAGQVLVVKVTGTGVTFQNGTNMRIVAGTFNADDADTLSLIWDGSAWVETARSINL